MFYGIVGTGWIAKSFVSGAKSTGKFCESAVYSRSETSGRNFAQGTDIQRVFTDINEMAQCREIEAVYIASPNCFHYEQSKLFLQHGKHVLCEKPICAEPEQTAELIALAREKNLVYMEAIMSMHNPARQAVHSAMNRLGTIRSARIDYAQLSSKYKAYMNGELPNIFNPKMATGCLMDLGVYCVYATLDFFGKPLDIVSEAKFLDSGADACGVSVFKYADKDVAVTYSKVGQSRIGSEIIGDNGTIVIGSVSKYTDIFFISPDGGKEQIASDESHEKVMSYEADDFYNFIVSDARRTACYAYQDMSLEVSRTMKKIRENARIKFE